MSSEKIIIEIADLVVEYCREPDGRTRAEDAISAAAAVAEKLASRRAISRATQAA